MREKSRQSGGSVADGSEDTARRITSRSKNKRRERDDGQDYNAEAIILANYWLSNNGLAIIYIPLVFPQLP